YSAYVEIWHGGHCVAQHERCYQRQQKVLELEHYLDTLEKKPGALAGSTALEQCRAQGRWPRSYDRFWEMATERIGRAAATRMMIDVLQLERRQGASHVRPALEQALAMGCANLGAIRYLLSVDYRQNNTLTPEVEADALRRYDRPLRSMEAYEQLRPNWPLATEVVQ
ncbi:MAG: hypothetical protein P4L40_22870, partial [Terracidiphilus sp.]|nr:hypothetical protein [Terracidiphilus sp.]